MALASYVHTTRNTGNWILLSLAVHVMVIYTNIIIELPQGFTAQSENINGILKKRLLSAILNLSAVELKARPDRGLHFADAI